MLTGIFVFLGRKLDKTHLSSIQMGRWMDGVGMCGRWGMRT